MEAAGTAIMASNNFKLKLLNIKRDKEISQVFLEKKNKKGRTLKTFKSASDIIDTLPKKKCSFDLTTTNNNNNSITTTIPVASSIIETISPITTDDDNFDSGKENNDIESSTFYNTNRIQNQHQQNINGRSMSMNKSLLIDFSSAELLSLAINNNNKININNCNNNNNSKIIIKESYQFIKSDKYGELIKDFDDINMSKDEIDVAVKEFDKIFNMDQNGGDINEIF